MKLSISPVSVIRDVGILIENKLTMSQRICTVVNKARTRASLIFKCFHARHRSTQLKAFVTYVRPLLEYATPERPLIENMTIFSYSDRTQRKPQ